jgi:hypothetical protein
VYPPPRPHNQQRHCFLKYLHEKDTILHLNTLSSKQDIIPYLGFESSLLSSVLKKYDKDVNWIHVA